VAGRGGGSHARQPRMGTRVGPRAD